MKIGLDFHGVIDIYPDLFKNYTKKWLKKGHEIHIITGKNFDSLKPKLNEFNISYTHHYSIVDYHKKIGTNMEQKESGWWMDSAIWDKSKGEYCLKNNISVHFDNDIQYAKWFPESCNFILVRKKNFINFLELFELP